MRDDLWAGGVVPYKVQPGLPSRRQVQEAVTRWNCAGVPVRLEPHEGQEDHVEFVADEYCSSRRGRAGGPQKITLSADCSAGVVLHEIGHAVGLAHEHNRPDRNRYLERICLENVYPEAIAYFQPRPDDGAPLGDYDFESIMHYSQMAFSRNGQPTIVPKRDLVPRNALIGQRRELSAGDIDRLCALYHPAAQERSTPGGGAAGGRYPQGVSAARLVTGRILLPAQAPTVTGMRATVRVRDLSYSDAPQRALLAGHSTMVDVSPEARIDFSIEIPAGSVLAGSTPSLEVHIDLDGNGYFSPGDLVSMAPHWLLLMTPGVPVDVPVSVV